MSRRLNDRYVLEAQLGAGAMGVVFRARDERLRRSVAIKLLTEQVVGLGSVRARFLREARAIAALEHPGIVRLYDVGELPNDGVFLVMELVQGLPLRRHIEQGSLTQRQRVHAVVEVAEALSFAHSRGFVHRDVKPDNIMIRDDGRAVVLDFGVAKSLPRPDEDGSHTTAVTRVGALIGTPHYLAPEQAVGGPVDARTDQFALGVVAYEVLTGRVPWKAKGLQELLTEIVYGDVPTPSSLDAHLPRGLDDVFLRCLAKEPANRFADIRSFALAFEATAALTPIAAPGAFDTTLRDSTPPCLPPTDPPRAPRSSLRRRLTYLALLPILALAAFGAGRRPWRAAAPATPSPGLTEYREGMQAFRDASMQVALQKLEKATELDPSLAQAHLRLAWMAAWDPETARAHLQSALRLRESLTPLERGFADALTPSLHEPPDILEEERRLAALAEQYPRDAEVLFQLGYVRFNLGRNRPAVEAADRALLADSSFAAALFVKTRALEALMDLDGARSTAQRCIEVSPSAASCLRLAAGFDQQNGDCTALLHDAKQMIAVEAGGWSGYGYLASALASLDAPRDAVLEALRKRWSFVPERARAEAEAGESVDLDALYGDFESAERRARELADAMPPSATEFEHTDLAHELIEIDTEMGRTDEAVATADRCYRARSGWSEPVGDAPIVYAAKDGFPTVVETLFRAGKLTRAARDAESAAWLEAWTHRLSNDARSYLWIPRYAAPAETTLEAKEALSALASYSPLPPPLPDTAATAQMGKVFLLAGDTEGALPLLRKGVSACVALDQPMAHTRAYWHLGQALEKAGDKAAACSAYGHLLSRWGQARPRSVSAERARARSAALGCDAG